jgi:hypothetical protein
MSSRFPDFTASKPSPYAHATAVSRSGSNPLIPAIIRAFDDAMAERGRLRQDAFTIWGFSGRKFRYFLNNLIADVKDPRYLEIGLFHGASFCCAISSNVVRAVGIDNWTEYGVQSTHFHENLEKFKDEGADTSILECDFRKVDYGGLAKCNIMFYDGSHSEKDQYDGVLLPQPAMDDKYILLVDDWNWARVRKGTFDALRDSQATIDYQIELRTNFGNDVLPLIHGGTSEWHNGCLIAAVSKGGG